MYSTYYSAKPRATKNSAAGDLLQRDTYTEEQIRKTPALRQLLWSRLGYPKDHDKPKRYFWSAKKADARKYLQDDFRIAGRKRKRGYCDDSSDGSDSDSADRLITGEKLSKAIALEKVRYDEPARKGLLAKRQNVAALPNVQDTADCIRSYDIVRRFESNYDFHFKDPNKISESTLEWSDNGRWPVIELVMPGEGYVEKYPLVVPLDGVWAVHEPIQELLSTIKLILDFFLTEKQAYMFFAYETPPTDPEDLKHFAPDPEDILILLNEAAEAQDGPAFVQQIHRFNIAMKELKENGTIKRNINNMKGVPEELWTKISFQVYERIVGPRIGELKNYEAFSDFVYGELLPPFMYDIMHQTSLGPGKIFVDLGCGVANCLLNMSLGSGCNAYGAEILESPADLAIMQSEEAPKRWRMFGLAGGYIKCKQADFLIDPEIPKWLSEVDVLLVNNYAFAPKTNRQLLSLFLELKDGAYVVSMKPFTNRKTRLHSVGHGRRTLEVAQDDDTGIDLMLKPWKKLQFGKDAVSWMPKGGEYHIARVSRGHLSSSRSTPYEDDDNSDLTSLSSSDDEEDLRASTATSYDKEEQSPSDYGQFRDTTPNASASRPLLNSSSNLLSAHSPFPDESSNQPVPAVESKLPSCYDKLAAQVSQPVISADEGAVVNVKPLKSMVTTSSMNTEDLI